MEGKNKKLVGRIAFFVLIFALLLTSLIQIIYFLGYGVSVTSVIYWELLVVWIYLLFIVKFDSSKNLCFALFLFGVGALFTFIGFKNFAETIMRVSFIGWAIGITQALVEYMKNGKER